MMADMDLQFPPPLLSGDRIGVTAPSSGVPEDLRPRLDFALAWLREQGFEVVVGECVVSDGYVSAPKAARARELTEMLTDPTINAVIPPWGGEMATDLLDLLDWDRIAAAHPRWLVGYSDLTTLMVPLTLRLGWASLHGANLMDTPYAAEQGVAHWLDVAGATSPITQEGAERYRAGGFDNWQADPTVEHYTLDTSGSWSSLHEGSVDVSGRLIGGCLEVLSPLAGSAYADIRAFGQQHAHEGLILYLEAAEDRAFSTGRALHGLRHAGWFEHANAVLIGRTGAPDSSGLTQHEAVRDALGMLDIPVILDVECGHVPPYLPLVNGAQARVIFDGDRQQIAQNW